MEYPRCVRQLYQRWTGLIDDPDAQQLQEGQASLEDSLDALRRLLCDPKKTLHVAGCMRPVILQLVSALLERQASLASPDEAKFCVALISILEVAPHTKRLVLQYFQQHPNPMHYLQSAQHSEGPSAQALAFSSLLALQLAPELSNTWGTPPFVQLLPHQCPAVRWAATQALAQLLAMSCASKSHLLDQLLSPQQLVDATAAWHTDRSAARVEMASAWLPALADSDTTLLTPLTRVDDATAMATDPHSEQPTQSRGAGSVSGRGRKRRGEPLPSTASPAAALPNQPSQPALPPARSFVTVCGVDLPCRVGAKGSIHKEAAGKLASGDGAGASKPGRLLSKGAGLPQRHPFVVTPTVMRNMQAAALSLCSGRPLLLEGPPGCGKTALLEELASKTGNSQDMVRVHLDDQLDAKALLGAYMCTAVPGEFTWQPGPLTQAVTEGRWLLVEDINMAPPDVLAALVPLLETGTLVVPSRGEVLHAAEGFQLLATVTSAPHAAGGGGGAYATSNMAKELLGGLWAYVRVEPAPEQEQLALLAAAYPSATPLLPGGVATLHLVQLAGGHQEAGPKLHQSQAQTSNNAMDEDGPSASGTWWRQAAHTALKAAGVRVGELALSLPRHFSVRDLFKWTARLHALHSVALGLRSVKKLAAPVESLVSKVSKAVQGSGKPLLSCSTPDGADGWQLKGYDLPGFDVQVREAAFVEAADLFTALIMRADARTKLLRALATLWALPVDQAVEMYETLHKPRMQEGTADLVVGRASLDRVAPGPGDKPAAGLGTFASTGHAMRLMERVAVSLAQNEPVMLVGETGTGKTTLVSRLAALTGVPLVSFNMSAQTDSSDLLGGFKPVEARNALMPLLEPFMDLMRQTWSKGKNEEFLSRCAKYAERRKWSHLVQAFKTALSKVQAAEAKAGNATTAAAGVGSEQGGQAAGVDGAAGASTLPTAPQAPPKKKHKKQGGGSKAAHEESKVQTSEAGSSSKALLSPELSAAWRAFAANLAAAERAALVSEGGFAFSFVEGKLVAALRHGWWLLLDEINLAPPEVLERLAGLLEGPAGSITLVERGDTHVIPRHPGFRLIAAMNPATDAGKRELPAALRNRLTEIWVPEPTAREDLRNLVHGYLAGLTVMGGPTAAAAPASASGGIAPLLQPVEACVDLYLAIKQAADAQLSTGGGQRPAYNLRTLCRALDYARTTAPQYGLQRALYDGFAMAFVTQLSQEGEVRIEAMLLKHLLPGMKSAKPLLKTPQEPPGGQHVLFEHFWLHKGPNEPPKLGRDDDGSARKFVLTASVKRQLCNLARAVLIRKHPILLQGPTSTGKTSLVAYLATQSGHTLVRINNHEHTDLQEYLGSYVSDASGRLRFQEGALVRAVRQGHWLVLDELNLAPSDVLEALNRLLDDNRELFVPELNEVVKPHPDFMLFATQNPPGAYAGRKALSAAFRSRFLELHVDELPDAELSHIIEQRCGIAPSYAAKLVAVMRELQRRRQATNVFAGKHGFITPRDLFRWAERGAVGYQALAEDGCLLLGERLRALEERAMVAEVISKAMNVKVNIEEVFTREGDAPFRQLSALLAQQQEAGGAAPAGPVSGGEDLEALKKALRGVAWTRSMRRMYTLVERCLRHQEPVLLIGETGTGKTTVCQLLALMRGQHLHILNCNQHTETSDFLGGFRPTRNREKAVSQFVAVAQRLQALTCWAAAGLTLSDLESSSPSPSDISTLNSQFQSSLAALLKWAETQAEHAGVMSEVESLVQQANEAAMAACAPFVWVDGPLVTAMRRGDMILIDEINLADDAVLERLNSVLEPGRTLTLAERGGEGAEVIVAAPGFRILATMNPGGDYGKKELSPALSNRFTSVWVPSLEDEEELQSILNSMLTGEELQREVVPRLLAFWRFFRDSIATPARTPLSLRDLLAWATFIKTAAGRLGVLPAYVHAAHLVLLDGLGLGVGLPPSAAAPLRAQCCRFLRNQLPQGQAQVDASAAEGDMQAVTTLQQASTQSSSRNGWGIHPFYVSKPETAGTAHAVEEQAGEERAAPGVSFELTAPTAARNAYRVLRALTLPKAVLLEGSPGVGKTALVAALAKRAGVPLVRINLSEQTDMMDLLGADLPAPGGEAGQFTWCDGPLLAALQQGAWVLLDELNLAGQSVLEGLNALLDHRAEVFIPELGATFRCHPSFRLFAAQNPLQEGGGRKGLPRSFLNRFTRVYVELLHPEDLKIIAGSLYPRLPQDLLQRMVTLLGVMQDASSGQQSSKGEVKRFAAQGGPWEFNLRDLLRWADLVEDAVTPVSHSETPAAQSAPGSPAVPQPAVPTEADSLDEAAEHFAHVLFRNRLRTVSDRTQFSELWQSVWGRPLAQVASTPVVLTPDVVCVGRVQLPRKGAAARERPTSTATAMDHDGADGDDDEADGALQLEHEGEAASHQALQDEALQLFSWQAPLLEGMMQALARGWMTLLVGGPGSGKTRIARLAARLAGRRLTELALTSGTDTSDLLGSFEQIEPARRVQEAASAVHSLVTTVTQRLLQCTSQQDDDDAAQSQALQRCSTLQDSWHVYCQLEASEQAAGTAATPESHIKRLQALLAALQACQEAAGHLPGGMPPGLGRRLTTLLDSLADLSALLADEASRAVAGRFEWVDGTLSRAIAQGGWVLLDNANLCNPTVLDRLNPLLEPGGSLFLAEAGSVQGQPRVITPHPQFRLILALDPSHGEVSRAMRNRGIELFLLPPPARQPAPTFSTLSAVTLNNRTELWRAAHAVCAAEGAAAGGPVLLEALADLHVGVCQVAEAAHRRGPGLGDLRSWLRLTRLMLDRGWAFNQALLTAWKLAYLGGLVLGTAEQEAATQLLHRVGQQLQLDLSDATLLPTTDQPDKLQLLESSDSSEDMEVDGVMPNGSIKDEHEALPQAATDHASSSKQQHLMQPLDLTNTSSGDMVLQHRPSFVPCTWPALISGNQLADHTIYSVMRDLSPLASAAAIAISCCLPAGGATPAWPSSSEQRAALTLLPVQVLAQHFSSSQARPSGQQLINKDLSVANQPVLAAAHQTMWSSLPIILDRSLSGKDSEMRHLWLQVLHQQCQMTSQLAGSSTGSVGTALLLDLITRAFASLSQHPLTTQLHTSTTDYLKAGGAPVSTTDLQPLNPDYDHATHSYTAAAAAAGSMGRMPEHQLLASKVRLLCSALPQALIQEQAAQDSDAAVSVDATTAFQLSVWRSRRPEIRAMQDPPHPVIDHLAPAFSQLTAVEQQLLALPTAPTGSAPPAWSGDLAAGWARVSTWRDALWSLVHGPLLTASGHTLPHTLDTEQITWVWQKLCKTADRFSKLPAATAVKDSPGMSQLLQVLAAGSSALGLDVISSKPLLWKSGGHPILPKSQTLLSAQLSSKQLARASSVLPSATTCTHVLESASLINGKGYPASLSVAGADAEQLIETAIETANPYLTQEQSRAARERVSTAVAGVMLCDVTLRNALTGGLALLMFGPVSEALRGSSPAKPGEDESLAQVSKVLMDQVTERASQAAADAASLEMHAAADISLLMSERLAAVPAPTNSSGQGKAHRLLLPAALMVAPSSRNLQARLLAIQDLHNLRCQLPLMSRAHQLLMDCLLHPATEGAAHQTQHAAWLSQCLPRAARDQLYGSVLAHMHHGIHGTTRSPADFVPHQQLNWVLDALTTVSDSQGARSNASNHQAHVMQYIVQVVLPAVLSDMWLGWHQAIWTSAASSGMLLQCGNVAFAASNGLSRVLTDQAPVRLLHSAAHAAAAAAVVLDCASAVQDRSVRVMQLRLSAGHLLKLAARAADASTTKDSASHSQYTWASLAALLVQVMWSHVSSLPSQATQQQLLSASSHLLRLVEQACSAEVKSTAQQQDLAAALQSVITSILTLLKDSSHAVLLSLLQPVLAPVLAGVVSGLVDLRATQSTMAASVSQQLQQGKTWAMLGLLRLHLVAPPPGIDPAGKYRLKVGRIQDLQHKILCEQSVRSALALLPGGPDEAPSLLSLASQSRDLATQAEDALSRCVPRPTPSLYASLAKEIKSFITSFASPVRITALLNGLAPSSSADLAARAAAMEAAAAWVSSAGGLCERLDQQYRQYNDILQPVILAVQEMRLGLGLLAGVPTQALQQVNSAAGKTDVAVMSATSVVSSLMGFPANMHVHHVLSTPVDVLMHPVTPQLVSSVAAATARLQTSHLNDPSKVEKAAELAAYTAGLHVRHVALHEVAKQLLAAGPAMLQAQQADRLQQLEQLLCTFLDQWAALKAYEEKVAAEEAQMFVSKARSTVILNEEEEAEAEYKRLHPDWSAPFESVPGIKDEPDLMAPDDPKAEEPANAAAEPAEASAAAAQSAAARQLLDGQILSDIVQLHAAVFAALGSVAGHSDDASQKNESETARDNFLRSYQLGAQVLAALGPGSTAAVRLDDHVVQGALVAGGAVHGSVTAADHCSLTLDIQLDDLTLTGHLYRTCLEAGRLSEAAAATAAEAVATSRIKQGAAKDDFTVSGIDIHQACVPEIVLLQEPVRAMAKRLAQLLTDFPEHPVLEQLAGIGGRLLALPLDTPLKTALTGLELLLARAQVWEETAAKFVSVKSELTDLAGLATRWRRLELASWRSTLSRVAVQHSNGANRSWFHLYQLLMVQPFQPTSSTADAAADESHSAESEDKWFRSTVSTLEAFMQTSTLGEYAARLQLLRSFQAHLQVRHHVLSREVKAGEAPDSMARIQQLVAALSNIHAYYLQFQPAIDDAIKVGMAPHEKDLSDFVALAKWEDRGYYSMKASTEKAQRHLHRLRRRGEDVLKQAAGGVLAQTMKCMGIGEYAAAAHLLGEPEPAPAPAPAAGAPGQGQQPGSAPAVPAAKAVKPVVRRRAGKRSSSKAKAGVKPPSLLCSQPSGLEVSELQEADVAEVFDPVLEPGTWAMWQQLSSAVAAANAIEAPAGAEAGAGQLLQARLPQLTRRMAGLMSKVLKTNPAVSVAFDQEETAADHPSESAGTAGDVDAADLVPGALQVDDLASMAAARAAALRSDKDKGCRLRKKKALTDFLHALSAVGLSKRQSDIPRNQRTVSDWFKQQVPQLDLLLASSDPLAASGPLPHSLLTLEVCEEVNEAWVKAQTYYVRSIARMQKVWSVKNDAHKDVSLAEANAAVRMCEHMLLISRQQRAALGDTSGLFKALKQLAAWVDAPGAVQQKGGDVEMADAGAAGLAAAGSTVGCVPQQHVQPWVVKQKATLDSLDVAAGETCELLAVCAASGSCDMHTQQQALQQAVAACQAWRGRLCSAKATLAKHMATMQLSTAGGMTWVTDATLETVFANYQQLSELTQQVQVYCQEAADWVPPGVASLGKRLQQADQDAQCFRAAFSAYPLPSHSSLTPESDMDHQLKELHQEFSSCLEAAISSVLVWSQGVLAATENTQKPPPKLPPGEAVVLPKGLPVWSTSLTAVMQLPLSKTVLSTMQAVLASHAATCEQLHEQLGQGGSSAAGGAASWQAVISAQKAQLSGLSPLMHLAAGVVQLQALRLTQLHKSTTKLAYITTSLFATLLEEGFCAPQEGEGTEGGGDGPGEWKEAEGTGMGDGDTRGARDVSDKITDEDQLLGAQQKDQPKDKEDHPQDMDDKDDGKGVEMEADFEGDMHDMDVDDKEQGSQEEEEEEGDGDRLDQQMGDTGDNSQRVDEKLWGDDEDEEQAQQERKEERDDKGSISVQDKKDLEYDSGKGQPEEEEQQGKDKDKGKKQEEAAKKPAPKDEPQVEDGPEEGDDDEEGGVNQGEDTCADKPEDYVQPEQPEAELELPEQLDLDGGEEPGPEEQPQGGDEEEPAAMDAEGPGAGPDDKGGEEQDGGDAPDQQQEGGPDEGDEGGEEVPGGDQQPQPEEQQEEQQQDEEAGAGQGGIGEAGEKEPEAPEEDEEEPPAEPTAAHGLGEQPQPPTEEQQQAGPKGVASAAVTQQGNKGKNQKSAPQAAPHPQQSAAQPAAPPPQPDSDEAGGADEPAPAPPSAQDQSAQSQGAADASQQGQVAPLDLGGVAPDAAQPQRRQRDRQERRQEANPLRDLGDALEQWRANLAVQHDVNEQDDGAGGADDEQGGEEPPGVSNAQEHQYLKQGDAHRAGDTQALAPATEDQAKELERATRHKEDAGDDDAGGQDGAGGMQDEEMPDQDQADQDEDAQRPAPVTGVAPKQWAGAQRDAKMAGEEVSRDDDADAADAGADVEENTADVVDALFGGDRAGAGDDEDVSRAIAQLDMGADDAQAMEEDELPQGLGAPAIAQLREELDAQLQNASALTVSDDPAAARYGSEVWSRCDALTSGLAGELTEQLRLILEPTLASRLAGDFRTGKRISMRKVIAYIASHFRKDKIWLRRSRPDKRRYQVVLAVDDSRSMAECGCGGVALEALTLLCKALSRLEVGQIGVVKFGGPAGVQLLHPLTTPFTDSAGPAIMSNLRFNQDNTIADQPMLSLVEALDHMLDVARHQGGAGGIGAATQDLAQLVLVVADGRLHEKDALRARLRDLSAKRGVCPVFIAIDSPAALISTKPPESKAPDSTPDGAAGDPAAGDTKPNASSSAPAAAASTSLLDMQAVTFQGGKPVFKRYMDDFPWPYYVLIRDLAALPRTLADLLRQWFELSAAGAAV